MPVGSSVWYGNHDFMCRRSCTPELCILIRKPSTGQQDGAWVQEIQDGKHGGTRIKITVCIETDQAQE